VGEVKAWWLRHALTPKPQPSDTRPFLARLLASTRIVVKGSLKKGITFFGIRGGADF
jgi:hypothetical protein